MKKYTSVILILTLLVSLFTGVSVLATEEAEATETVAVSESNTVTEEMVEAYADVVKARTPDNESIESIFTLIDENDNLALYAVTNNDDLRMGEVAVLDKTSGYVWRSNPVDQNDDVIGKAYGHAYYRTKSQIAVSFTQGYNYFDANDYYESILSNKVSCKVEDGAVKFVFRFRETDFAVPVRYSLDGDAFVAENIFINLFG